MAEADFLQNTELTQLISPPAVFLVIHLKQEQNQDGRFLKQEEPITSLRGVGCYLYCFLICICKLFVFFKKIKMPAPS